MALNGSKIIIECMPEQKKEPKRLTPNQILHLPILKHINWLEVIGEYLGSAEVKGTFHLAIKVKEKVWRISVPMKSKEREILDILGWLDDLSVNSDKKKRRVRILFTDDPEKPVVIRTIERV
jgi:hypothetical protein